MDVPRPASTHPHLTLVADTGDGSLVAGAELGPYIIAELLGVGGMGEVYKAFDPRLGRHVAIKILRFGAADSEELRRRFEREIRVVSALAHKNICTVFDTGVHRGRSFVVMELLEGRTLEAALAVGPLPLTELLDVAIQVADALKAAHERDLVHRDIKSANIFLTSRADAKVLDFGIAKSFVEDPAGSRTGGLTQEGMIIGTVAYMSPEQALGDIVDARSDLFSFGVVLYHMATGAIPYQATMMVTLTKIASLVPVPRVIDQNPSLPRALDRIICRALEKDRTARYQSADELLVDLRALRQDISSGRVLANAPRTWRRTLGFWIRRRRAVLASAALLLAALTTWRVWPPAAGATIIRSVLVQGCAEDQSPASVTYQCRVIAASITAALDSVRTITLRYQEAPTTARGAPPAEAGRQAGTDAVLTTRLDSGATGWHAQVLLTRSRTGDIVWSQSYPVAATEVITLPERITTEVVAALSTRAESADHDRLQPLMQLRQADYQAGLRTAASLDRAVALYNEVLRRDSTLARAYSGLAMARLLQSYYTQADPSESYRAAMRAAESALRYDEGLSEAHAALGLAFRDFDWNWVRAESELRMAVDLDSTSTNALQWYAELLNMTGRSGAAEPHVVAASRLRPLELTPRAVHGWILLSSNRPADAAAVLRATLEMSPTHHLSRYFLGASLLKLGDPAGAIRELRTAVALAPDTRFYLAGLGYVLARTGQRDEALRILETFGTAAGGDATASPYYQAVLHAGLGDREAALRALDRAVSVRDRDVVNIKVDSFLDPLRADPRFAALVRRAGLPSEP